MYATSIPPSKNTALKPKMSQKGVWVTVTAGTVIKDVHRRLGITSKTGFRVS